MALSKPLLLYGLRFDASSYNLVVTSNLSTETLRFPPAGTDLDPDVDYYVSGDGQTDDTIEGGTRDLLEMLALVLESHTLITAVTVTLTSDFKVLVTCTGGTPSNSFSLEWSDVLSTLSATGFTYGFDPNVDTILESTATSDRMPQGIRWMRRPFNVDTDNVTPTVGEASETARGDQRSVIIGSPYRERTIGWAQVGLSDALLARTRTSEPWNCAEAMWLTGLRNKRGLRIYPSYLDLAVASYSLYRHRGGLTPTIKQGQSIDQIYFGEKVPLVKFDRGIEADYTQVIDAFGNYVQDGSARLVRI